MEKLKKCSKCGRELPVSEFWKNASTEDGGKSSVSCPLKPSDSAPLKHSTMPP